MIDWIVFFNHPNLTPAAGLTVLLLGVLVDIRYAQIIRLQKKTIATYVKTVATQQKTIATMQSTITIQQDTINTQTAAIGLMHRRSLSPLSGR